MRTKTLLLSAAVLAAGVASSMAANVYSVNVVGYINVALPGDQTHNGGAGLYSLIENPLDASNNGGNTLLNVFPAPADGSLFLMWDPVHNLFQSDSFAFGSWANGGTNVVAPGAGIFVLSDAPWTNTFVGTVMQGNLSNPFGTVNVNSFIGSQVPLTGTADSLNLTPGLPDGTLVEPWDLANQRYLTGGYTWAFGSWSDPSSNPNPPPVAIAQGFLVITPAGSPAVWATNFTVQ
jgi:hypothetical protein